MYSVSTNQKSGFQNTYVSKILAHDPALDDEYINERV